MKARIPLNLIASFCFAFFLPPLTSCFLFADISANGVYTRSGTNIHIQIVDCGNPNCSLTSYYSTLNSNLNLLPPSQLLSIKTISSAPMDYTNPNSQHWYDTTRNSITLYVDYENKYGNGPFLFLNSVADQVYNYQLTPAQKQTWDAMQPSGGFPPLPSAEQYFIGIYNEWIINSYRVLDGLREPNGLYIPTQDVFFMAGVMTDPTTHQMTYNQQHTTPQNPLNAPIIPGNASITLTDGLLTIAGTNIYRVTNNAVTAVEWPNGTFEDLSSPLPLPQIFLQNADLSSGISRRPLPRPIAGRPIPLPGPRSASVPQQIVYTGSNPTAYVPLMSAAAQQRLQNALAASQKENSIDPLIGVGHDVVRH